MDMENVAVFPVPDWALKGKERMIELDDNKCTSEEKTDHKI